jgi:hypothetical protein
MSTIAYRLAQRRVQAVEEAIEDWQLDHARAMLAGDVEDLVAETASLREPLERMAETFANGIGGPNGDALVVPAHHFGYLLTRALALFPRVRDLVAEVRRSGYAVDHLDRLSEAESALARLREETIRNWLLPDEQTVRRGREEMARGLGRVL